MYRYIYKNTYYKLVDDVSSCNNMEYRYKQCSKPILDQQLGSRVSTDWACTFEVYKQNKYNKIHMLILVL